MDDFSKRLRWVREQLGLTLAQASKSMDAGPSTVFYWENSSIPKSTEKFKKLADFYNTLWTERFTSNFPTYKNYPVEYISIVFLMTGKDDSRITDIQEFNDSIMQDMRNQIQKMAIDMQILLREIKHLKGELNASSDS